MLLPTDALCSGIAHKGGGTRSYILMFYETVSVLLVNRDLDN
jgi:hypothetical protein